jgi:hypothetical protein
MNESIPITDFLKLAEKEDNPSKLIQAIRRLYPVQKEELIIYLVSTLKKYTGGKLMPEET